MIDIKKFVKKYWIDYFNANQKKLIVFLIIILIILGLIFVYTYANYKLSDSYVDKTVCISAMKEHTLQYRELSLIKFILLEYDMIIKLLLICIGVGWMLHGVGFKVIGS